MVEKSLNRGRNESIFPAFNSAGGTIRRSAHWQNISHVVPHISKETSAYLNRHYGKRGGSLDWTREEVGLMVQERTPEIVEHAAYLSATAGRRLHVWEIGDLQNGQHPADTLVVPYIHTKQTEDEVKRLGQESWGLPPGLVAELKNKVSFHEAVSASGVEGFEVPEYKIATLGGLEKAAGEILKYSENLYTENGLSGRYPLGVVIRAEESDGNYGSVIINELRDKTIKVVVNGHPLEKEIDGKHVEVPPFRKGMWKRALHEAQAALQRETAKGINPRFVVSRYMDLADSPGLSLVLNKGAVESLGWNGQIQAEGTKACVGTEKYAANTPYLAKLQTMYEDKTASDFENFIREAASRKNIPFDSITGLINVDIMLFGPLEMELRRRRGQGEGYSVAECNARYTNYTGAAMSVLGLTGGEPTPRQIQTVVWRGVTNIDQVDLKGASEEAVREELFAIVQPAQEEGDPNLAFMLMPDSPAGITLTGKRGKAQEKVNLAIKRAKIAESGRSRIIFNTPVLSGR